MTDQAGREAHWSEDDRLTLMDALGSLGNAQGIATYSADRNGPNGELYLWSGEEQFAIKGVLNRIIGDAKILPPEVDHINWGYWNKPQNPEFPHTLVTMGLTLQQKKNVSHFLEGVFVHLGIFEKYVQRSLCETCELHVREVKALLPILTAYAETATGMKQAAPETEDAEAPVGKSPTETTQRRLLLGVFRHAEGLFDWIPGLRRALDYPGASIDPSLHNATL